MNENKNVWMIGGVILVVVAIIVFVVMQNKDKDNDDLLENEGNVVEDELVVEGEAVVGELDTIPDVKVTKSPVVSLTYEQALIKYKDYRLQIDTQCRVSPNNITYKNKTNIMLDNRSPVSRTVKVGSTYTIKPWGFKIITVSASTFPTKLLVDCDKSQNVATILVQK